MINVYEHIWASNKDVRTALLDTQLSILSFDSDIEVRNHRNSISNNESCAFAVAETVEYVVGTFTIARMAIYRSPIIVQRHV